MALKTFNIDEKIYMQFSKYCKKEGLSMSKRIENFIKKELELLDPKSLSPRRQSPDVKERMLKYCG